METIRFERGRTEGGARAWLWRDLAVRRRVTSRKGYIIVHQPSGLVLCSAVTLWVARRVAASIAHLDLSVLDRPAAGEERDGDRELLRQIEAIVKGIPGTF
jgi:hypothetical protein